LAISTLLFGDPEQPDARAPFHEFPHPFRNCIVLGLMLGEDGGKMSKSKRNYREPQEIFDRFGADAMRWYFFANQAPWTSVRYSETAIKESIPEFLLRLWNVYRLFVIYANIDGFAPENLLEGTVGQLTSVDLKRATGYRSPGERGELDRWLLSELQRTIADTIRNMDVYDNFPACTKISEFVDALSNWYVRRSRDRFWSADRKSQDKQDAYWTLYECLLTTAKLVAPFTPFVAEILWQNLAGVFGSRVVESVHLCDYPAVEASSVDEALSEKMQLLREIASLGRSARMESKLKVRQPLSKVEVILADAQHQAWLEAHDSLLRDELNVKLVEYTEDADKYITYHVQPNFKRLGPRLGKRMPLVKKALTAANGAVLLGELEAAGKVSLQVDGETVELDGEDMQVRLQAKAGWAAAQGPSCVVVLATQLTDQLVREGLARDLVRHIQERRKAVDCQYTDRIDVGIVTDSSELQTAIEENRDHVASEILANTLVDKPLADVEPAVHEIAGSRVEIFLRVVSTAAAE
jgi:isoleucyl-tRNA synthetase